VENYSQFWSRIHLRSFLFLTFSLSNICLLFFPEQLMWSRTASASGPPSGGVWEGSRWPRAHRCSPTTSAEPSTYKEFSLIPVLGLSPKLVAESSVRIVANVWEEIFLCIQVFFHSDFILNSGQVFPQRGVVFILNKNHIGQQIPLLNNLKCKLNSSAIFF
jgi:hypothetical protein